MKKLKNLALAVLATLSVGATTLVATPAEAAAIRCKTTLSYNNITRKTTAKVVSLNKTGTRLPVHSYVLYRSNGDDIIVRVLDKRSNNGKGYSNVVTVSGYYFAAYSYQAGTRCRSVGTGAG